MTKIDDLIAKYDEMADRWGNIEYCKAKENEYRHLAKYLKELRELTTVSRSDQITDEEQEVVE